MENSLTMLHFLSWAMSSCMRTCNQFSWGGRTIFTSMIPFLHHSTYSLPWFHFFTTITPFTIHQHLFSNDTLLHFASYAILACFINITKGLSYAHYDFQWLFTLLLKKREQKMKWMLLTQEPTFFVFMVVTQEPTIRKCKLLLMSFTYPGNIHY